MILSTIPGSSLPALAVLGSGLPAIEGRRVAALSTIVGMVQAGRTPRHVAAYVYGLGPSLGCTIMGALSDASGPASFASAVLDILGDEPWFA
jgi:hypothetical protein